MDGNSPHARPALQNFHSLIERPASSILKVEPENGKRTADRKSCGSQEWQDNKASSVRGARCQECQAKPDESHKKEEGGVSVIDSRRPGS